MKNNKRTLWAAVLGMIVILSVGCAALSPLTPKQETLEERVKNYMQAQIDGKWDIAYSFFEASYRARVSREAYINRPKKMAYKGFAVDEITVLPPGDQATVKVSTDFSFMGYEFKRAPQMQNWIKEKGAWFLKAKAKAKASSRSTPFGTLPKKP